MLEGELYKESGYPSKRVTPYKPRRKVTHKGKQLHINAEEELRQKKRLPPNVFFRLLLSIPHACLIPGGFKR